MKYLIYTEDSLDNLIGANLSREISRFDIRAEIITVNSRSAVKKELKNGSFDLLIEIGCKAESSFNKPARKNEIRRCFIYQSVKRNKGKRSSFDSIDLTLGDIPNLSLSTKYLGNPLFDVVKSYGSSDAVQSDQTIVAFVTGYGTPNLVTKGFNQLGNELGAVQLVKADLEHEFEHAIQLIKNSNASVATSSIGEYITLYLNCPSVRVNYRSIFKKDNFSLINKLTEREVLPVCGQNQKEMIKTSLNKILQDHNYCAGILQDYQEAKDLLGSEPATRNIARYIVDWLEED